MAQRAMKLTASLRPSVLVLCFFLGYSVIAEYVEEPLLYEQFPDDFAWALATASYQIEGAWDEDGKLLETSRTHILSFFFYKRSIQA